MLYYTIQYYIFIVLYLSAPCANHTRANLPHAALSKNKLKLCEGVVLGPGVGMMR